MRGQWFVWVVLVLPACLTWPAARAAEPPAPAAPGAKPADEAIDFQRARQLLQKRERGETLTADEQAYLRRAIEARQRGNDRPQGRGGNLTPRESTGLIPLCDMSADDRYQGQDGGLYGGGRNTPPDEHRQAAGQALKQIVPRDANGKPSADGRIVLVSISMSNATQEFSRFKRIADADPGKAHRLTIVDCAQGGQAMAEWAPPDAQPWTIAERLIANAKVTPQQVQVAWIKLANKGPRGALDEHGRKLAADTTAVLHNARKRFPNLQVVYLGSRIYGGYAASPLNPEPYAYESAFVVRWLIQDQIAGKEALNYDAARGVVQSPLLLWGPYLWADGTKGRRSDSLVWNRVDLADDGTHPSDSGRDKVARLLLEFFKSDPLAQPWFVDKVGR